ncbi:MAG: DNA primase [Cytophagales bacterium]|nr:MAG: DNA primase [Cytophagales bacterium]
MALDKETIDRIKESSDIVEVISDYITLKKRGQNYIACCPFHNEKTPSFNVSVNKGIYKCFGCGAVGDAIQFVMDIEGIGYLETLKQLAKKYGIALPETPVSDEERNTYNDKESLYIILNYAKNYYQQTLLQNEEGKAIGLSYFTERGFSKETINKFELGYSLDQWDSFTKTALENQYSLDLLEKSGLSIKKENNENEKTRHYDRFRGRVIFPIHNVSGKTIAFGARTLKNEKNQPKYINSPETDVYHKSKILYGIAQAKNAIRTTDNCYLVEGYTDVISMHQAGVENVVASSGTSLTEEQIKLIGRYTQNITVLYDGDAAGIKASIRGIDMILEAGLNVNVLLFPDGNDPDSYIKKIGAPSFRTYIQNHQQDFITFKTELFLKEAANDPIKKAGVIKEIVESIGKIPDGIKRAVLFKQCSQLLQIDEQVLISENNKIQIQKTKKNNDTLHNNQEQELPITDYLQPNEEEKQSPSEIDLVKLQEKELIRLLINFGNEQIDGKIKFVNYLLQEVSDHEFKDPLYNEMLKIIKNLALSNQEIDTSIFLSHPNNDIKNEAFNMMANKYQISNNWEKFQIFIPTEKDNLFHTVYSSIMRLKWRSIRDMIEINMENLLQPLENEETQKFQKVHIELKNAEKQVASLLGIVIGN